MTYRLTKLMGISLASLGTVVEWYDFMLFAYMTPIFSKLFFPHQNTTTSVLMTFGVYAAGFFMAPLGSLFFGSMGDRLGRRKALYLSVVLMSIPMFLTAVLPTYQEIGVLASILLILTRLVQGFSIGGQYGGTMVLMIENARPGLRGLVGSIATMTSGMGVFLASLVVACLVGALSHSVVLDWGWRIPYIIGAALSIVALLMRLKMPETQAFESLSENQLLNDTPMRSTFKRQLKPLLLATWLSSYANIAYYLIASYLSVYLETVLHFNHAIALTLITVFGMVFAFTAPLWGMLSDIVGRKSLLFYGSILFIIISYPAFHLLMSATTPAVAVGLSMLSLPLMMIWGAYGAAAPELFATQYRYCGTSISYNIGNSFFGGITPFVATLFISMTGMTIMPVWLLIVPAVMMLPILYFMPETSRTVLYLGASHPKSIHV